MLPFISVRLQVITWTRVVAAGGNARDRLSFTARLIDREEFRSPKPGLRDLRSFAWDIDVVCDGWTSPLGGIGVASHYPEVDTADYFFAEHFGVCVATTPEQFRKILELLGDRSGQQLIASFDLDGLVYGWEPDGSSVEWDLANPNLPVQNASFILKPVSADDGEGEGDDDTAPGVAGLRQPAGAEGISQHSAQLSSIIGLLRFLAAVAVGACLVAVLR